jgi:hypothetical protein
MSKEFETTDRGNFPLQVTIATPSYIPHARGIHATGRMGAHVRLRLSSDDRKLIEAAAALCGVQVSSFTRWCTVYAADAIVKAMGEQDSDESMADERS